jgi:glycosyltransferase involved in cell wall biosynthesis
LLKKIIRTTTVALSLDLLLKGQLSFLKEYFEVIALSNEDEYLKNVEKREKVRTISVEMQRNISPVKDLKSLYSLYRVFKKEKPTIVHSITPKAGLLSMIAGYFAGVPIRMHTFTGLIFPTRVGLIQKILIAMDRLLCKCATNIYPEGEGVKNDLIRYKITKKPLKILANGNINGLNTSHFNPELFTFEENRSLKEKLSIKEEDFVFIFVGRIVGDKGINELIAAFDNLCRSFQNIKLLLLGDFESDLDPLYTSTLKIIEGNGAILSPGFQQDVRPYFAIADALVFPSYREGFPNVVLQAGSMCLPSIVSDINGCNEIIKDEENGLIISVRNPEAIYKAMKRLIEDLELKNKLQKNARNMIIELYEQKIVWKALLKEYKCLEKMYKYRYS